MTEVQPTKEELINKFAQVQQITIKEAQETIGAETPQEILQNIKKFTQNKIKSHMNRAQRRAAARKKGKKGKSKRGGIADVAKAVTKINYIDLIQRLRELNKKREEEENENTKKSDLPV